MMSISLGPVALPWAAVLLAASVWAATLVASWVARRAPGASTGADAGAAQRGGSPSDNAAAAPQRAATAADAVIHAALFGLLAARLTYLAQHASDYWATPWAVFDIRDGGWHAGAGALAGCGWLLWRAGRSPALRRALGSAALVGAALWGAGTWATRGPDAVLPAVALSHLASGQAVTLMQAAQGRPLVVNLWATWCGPCRQEMPVLAAAQQREAAVGFVFVNQGERAETVRAYLAAQGLALREVLLDPASALGPAVGSGGLPTTLFYDAHGRQVDAHFGVLNAAALQSRLALLRAAR